jgi:hypothetical protein
MSQKFRRDDRPRKKITLEDQIRQQHELDLLKEVEAIREAKRQLDERDKRLRKEALEDDFDITGGAL